MLSYLSNMKFRKFFFHHFRSYKSRITALFCAILTLPSGCCSYDDTVTVDVSFDRVGSENWNGFKPSVSDIPILTSNYTIILSANLKGLENYGRPKTRGLFISPDCDPPYPPIINSDPLTAIRIIALKDLSSEIPAGSDATQLFRTRIINLNPLRAQPEIVDFDDIDLEVTEQQLVNAEANKKRSNQEEFKYIGLFLYTEFDESVEAQFLITYEFSSTKTLIDTTELISLTF